MKRMAMRNECYIKSDKGSVFLRHWKQSAAMSAKQCSFWYNALR